MMDDKQRKLFWEKIKKIKSIEYFVFILIIAIVISLMGNMFQEKDKGGVEITQINPTTLPSMLQSQDHEKDQEFRLKSVLSAIKGAGSVEVMITYKTSKEIVPAMNTIRSNTETEELDSHGGIRKVTQTDINSQPVSMHSQSGSEALIIKEVEPVIQGVIVIAQGADDLRVRLELQRAVQTVLGIQVNQVEVFIMDEKRIKE